MLHSYTFYILILVYYSGGSSGGEGALLALDGSAIGVNYLLISKSLNLCKFVHFTRSDPILVEV
jgi:hypothetical protein